MDSDVASYAKTHAILASTGFLILLPLGILIPRLTRTFTPRWFYAHAAFQFLLAGPIIAAGFAMGVKTAMAFGQSQFSDTHQKTGLALFILYLIQVIIGITSHFFKQPSHRYLLHRAPQRWLHITLGLAIIGLAFYQVHLGYTYEWVNFVETDVPGSVGKAWLAWVIIIPILYALGLLLLPRQISQETAARREAKKGSA